MDALSSQFGAKAGRHLFQHQAGLRNAASAAAIGFRNRDADPASFPANKELEVHKLRQKSVSELLSFADKQLGSARDNGGRATEEEHVRSIERIDPDDPNAAYTRIMETWRKSTK